MNTWIWVFRAVLCGRLIIWGATSPYEKGQFFAWGEVESKDDFSWENYRFFKGYDSNKGNTAILENIGDDISATEYDAARFQWGNGWRLPNEKEKYELLRYCWSNGLLTEMVLMA